MKRDILAIAVLWVVLTVVGEVLVLRWAPFPDPASEQAHLIDNAYRFLAILAVPVLAFVIGALLYVIPRFRSGGAPEQDGPPIHTHGPTIAVWLLATTALTIVMIIHPGVRGMLELQREARHEPDLVVQAHAVRWAWRVTYPEQKVSTWKEMVVPVGKRVRFEVTAEDVLHAFWVPAFRMKIDAVPGRVTTVYATPNRLGSFEDAYSFKVQCAELCGLGHGVMAIPVRVVAQAEFEAWAAQQSAATTAK